MGPRWVDTGWGYRRVRKREFQDLTVLVPMVPAHFQLEGIHRLWYIYTFFCIIRHAKGPGHLLSTKTPHFLSPSCLLACSSHNKDATYYRVRKKGKMKVKAPGHR